MSCNGSRCGIPPHPLGDHPCGCEMAAEQAWRDEQQAEYEREMEAAYHREMNEEYTRYMACEQAGHPLEGDYCPCGSVAREGV